MAARDRRMSGPLRPAFVAGPIAGAALLAVAACSPGQWGFGAKEEVEPVAVAALPADEPPAAATVHVEPPPAPDASRPAPPVPFFKPSRLVTVAFGDTVSGIAYRYGVTERQIVELNRLDHPYWLLEGMRIALPEHAAYVERWDDAHVEYKDDSLEAVPRPAVWEADALPRDKPSGEVAHGRVNGAPPPPPDAPRRRRANSEAEVVSASMPTARNSFLWPIEGQVISGFGTKPDGMYNDGINIAAPVGSDVRAAQSGVVAYAGNELRGYGNLVLIRHDDEWMTAYAHNEALLVERGDVVRRGQVISRSGKSGRVSRPQTHFEIRRNGEPQDPLRLLTRK